MTDYKKRILNRKTIDALLQNGAEIRYNHWYCFYAGYCVYRNGQYIGTVREDTFYKIKKEKDLKVIKYLYSAEVWG